MNIQEHVEGHAVLIINENKRVLDVQKTLNFVASIDIAQFIMQRCETQKDIDALMSELLKNIVKAKYMFAFKNGVRKKKNGDEVQKYRNNTIDLTNTVSAYHNVSVNGYTSVEPHVHILFEKNEFYFSTLQNILQNEANKMNLVFNFAEATRIDHDFSDTQQLVAKRFSWMVQMKDDNGFKTWLDSDQFDESLRFFYEYTKKRDLLAMAIKAMSYLKHRLDTLKIDKLVILDEEKYNLRESYPLYLRHVDYLLLEKVKSGKIVDEFPRDSIFSREYLKYCSGYKTELMEVLHQIGYQIPMIDKHEVKNKFKNEIKLKPKYVKNTQTENQINMPVEHMLLTSEKQNITEQKYHKIDVYVASLLPGNFIKNEDEDFDQIFNFNPIR